MINLLHHHSTFENIFPYVDNVRQLTVAIAGAPEFQTVRNERDGTVGFVYRVSTDQTFFHPDPIIQALRRECRGIMFDERTHKIIRRPYHKFFNLGETRDSQYFQLPPTGRISHRVMEKLDGTLIAPYQVPATGELVWGTKAGRTDISDVVRQWVSCDSERRIYDTFVRSCLLQKLTPLFEWCSPTNIIIVPYPTTRLVLTGMRHFHTGEYLPYEMLVTAGSQYGIPVAGYLDSAGIDETIGITDALIGQEGYVVRYASGHMIKLKSPWYLSLHRMFGGSDADITILAARDGLDDFLGFFADDEDLQNQIREYGRVFNERLQEAVSRVSELIRKTHGTERRDYTSSPNYSPVWGPLVFAAWGEPDQAERVVRNILDKACRSRKGIRSFCDKYLGGLRPPLLMFRQQEEAAEIADDSSIPCFD
jgi:RNA ligase